MSAQQQAKVSQTGPRDFVVNVTLPDMPETWPEPEEIPDTLFEVYPLPVEIIPAPFRPWIADIAHRMAAPLDFVAIPAVIAAAATIGAACGIRPKRRDDWLVIPNLWGGLVAPPSKLKTPSMTEALKPLARLEADAAASYEDAKNAWEADKEFTKARKENLKGEMRKSAKDMLSGQDLKREYADIKEPEPPARRRYKSNDGTVEKLGEILRENQRGVLLYRDELVGFLAGLEREGRETDRAFFLEAWNGYGGFTVDRIGRGTVDVPNLCLSILGGIQPDKLAGYLRSAQGFENDGLLQRFQLLVWPDDRPWKMIDEWPDKEAKNRAYTIFQRLAEIDFKLAGAETDDDGRPFLRFDPEAQELFYEWLTDLQAKIEAESGLMAEHLAKYRSLMPSLALVFHLIDVADTRPDTLPAVSLASAQRAAAWCDYLETHARRIYASAGNARQVAIKALAAAIRWRRLSGRASWKMVLHPATCTARAGPD